MTESNNPEMEIESTVDATSEVEAQEGQQVEDQQAETEEEARTQEDEAEEGEEQEENEEVEDDPVYEIDGEEFRLSDIKEWKQGNLRQSDYTKKTQEVAEMRKAVEEQQQQTQKQIESQQKNFKDYAEIYSIDEQIKTYEQAFNTPEWKEVIQNDQAQALTAEHEYRTLQNLRNQKLQEIGAREQEATLKQQQEIAKREEDTRQTLQRDIPGWGIEKAEALKTYAKSQGVQGEFLEEALKYDSLAVKMLNKAYLYDQIKAKTIKPKPKLSKKPVKSIKATSSNATSNLPSDSDPTDVWMEKEWARMAKRGII